MWSLNYSQILKTKLRSMLGGMLLCQLFFLFLVGVVARSFLFTDAEETALSGFMTADLLLFLFVCTDGACRVGHNFLHISFFLVYCGPVRGGIIMKINYYVKVKSQLRGQTLDVALSNVG